MDCPICDLSVLECECGANDMMTSSKKGYSDLTSDSDEITITSIGTSTTFPVIPTYPQPSVLWDLSDEQMNQIAEKVADIVSEKVLDKIVEKILLAEKDDE